MTTTGLDIRNTHWLRQVRGWCGILLMAVSLNGGYCVASEVTEETSSEETSEILEFAHRLSDGSQRSLRRRVPSRHVRLAVTSRVAEAATHGGRAIRDSGSVTTRGHTLSNGLCAPHRC